MMTAVPWLEWSLEQFLEFFLLSTFRHTLFGGGNGTGVHTSNAYIFTERTAGQPLDTER